MYQLKSYCSKVKYSNAFFCSIKLKWDWILQSGFWGLCSNGVPLQDPFQLVFWLLLHPQLFCTQDVPESFLKLWSFEPQQFSQRGGRRSIEPKVDQKLFGFDLKDNLFTHIRHKRMTGFPKLFFTVPGSVPPKEPTCSLISHLQFPIFFAHNHQS